MDKNANDTDIIKAGQMSCAHQMILKLPRSYETDIGAWGSNISSGQRQRIALARAFYGNPKLLILDEPNSNLDLEGEMSLVSALRNAKENKITTLIIYHRSSILDAVDKILVLSDGEAKLFGIASDVIKSLREKNNG
jgi:ATP-binding cassette subfamily C protein